MRLISILLVCSLILLLGIACTSSSDPPIYSDNFFLYSTDEYEIAYLRHIPEEDRKWEYGIETAIQLLPADVLETIISYMPDDVIEFIITIDPDDLATGRAYDDGVSINEKPGDPPDWATWESFFEDGLDTTEATYIILHELGHLYHFAEPVQSNFFNLLKPRIDPEENDKWILVEEPPTLYPTARDEWRWYEDFAESFALYVMWPDYLQEYCPLRYEFMQKIFNSVEYEPFGPMPSSVTSRLTKCVKSGD